MILKGVIASEGIALAKGLVIKERHLEDCLDKSKMNSNPAEEIEKFIHYRDLVIEDLERMKRSAHSNQSQLKTDLIDVQQMLLRDQMLYQSVSDRIQTEGESLLEAVRMTIEEQALTLEALDDAYLCERALDIRDIGKRLVNRILGLKEIDLTNLNEDAILVAKAIMPSLMISADVSKIKGIITELGGMTSHTAIIAKSLDIPAIVGASNAVNLIQDRELVAIDGFGGIVETELTEERQKEVKEMIVKVNKEKVLLQSLLEEPANTKDGREITLLSNAIDINSVDKAREVGADGIGLYRTEFLFMERKTAPTEEEQYQVYKEVLTRMNGRPVTFRTLDIGGDKEIPYLNLTKEENPFLGYRAIRICLKEKQLFRIQLRAILKASVFGKAQIMYPMISSLEEVRAANAELREVKEELKQEGIPYDNEVPIGIMIEIPSAAVIADLLIKEVDFFSIGTNDLTQYLLAVDRLNENVNYLYSYYHPAVLQTIKVVIQAVIGAGEKKSVSMCGEMAGDPAATMLLLGMGLKKFSITPSVLLKIKKMIKSIDLCQASQVMENALKLSTAKEIEQYLKAASERYDPPKVR